MMITDFCIVHPRFRPLREQNSIRLSLLSDHPAVPLQWLKAFLHSLLTLRQIFTIGVPAILRLQGSWLASLECLCGATVVVWHLSYGVVCELGHKQGTVAADVMDTSGCYRRAVSL